MATATLVTSEQFLALPDRFDASGNQIPEELIGGEIVQISSASKIHDAVKTNISDALGYYFREHRELGLRMMVEASYEITQNDTLKPDVSVIRKERLAEPGRILRGAPEIAIEVVSPSDRAGELKHKITTYLENGARAAWIFYDDGSVMVHTASQARELKGDQVLEDPLLPGFSEPVSSFFAF